MRVSKRSVPASLTVLLLALLIANAGLARLRAQNYTRLAPVLVAPAATPRVLLFGSSNVLWGLSAGALGRALQRPAYNLADQQIGPNLADLLTRRVVPLVHPGDLVIVSDRQWRVPQVSQPDGPGRLFYRLFPTGLGWVPYLNHSLKAQALDLDADGDLQRYPADLPAITVRHGAGQGFDAAGIALMVREADALRAAGACPLLAATPLLVTPGDQAAMMQADEQRQQQARAAGLGDFLLETPAIYTDPQLFVDDAHLNAQGRARWTAEVAGEIRRRRLCGTGD